MTPLELAAVVQQTRTQTPAQTELSAGIREAQLDQLVMNLALAFHHEGYLQTVAELHEFYGAAGVKEYVTT